jgi:rare lipoprotein A
MSGAAKPREAAKRTMQAQRKPRPIRRFLLPAAPLLLVLVAACTTRVERPAGPRPIPRSSQGHELVGEASWYGPGFEGNPTASGELFTGDEATAAHRTFPFGTIVRVRATGGRLEGRSVEVRINDRGPFVAGRVIDLSRTAARQLGLDREGIAPVELAVLSWGSELRRPGEEDPERPWLVQVGCFASYENARQLRLQVSALRKEAVEVRERAGLYRVYVGPFPRRTPAEEAADDLRKSAVESVLVPAASLPPPLPIPSPRP